eukprot:5005744-Prymnesium_polylepis.1
MHPPHDPPWHCTCDAFVCALSRSGAPRSPAHPSTQQSERIASVRRDGGRQRRRAPTGFAREDARQSEQRVRRCRDPQVLQVSAT